MKKFWAYFRALNMCSGSLNATNFMWGMYACVGSLFLYDILIGSLAEESMPVIVVFGSFFCCGFVVALLCTRCYPSLYHLLPISPKRNILYFFLSSLVMSFIVMGALFLVAAITALIVALVILVASGEWIIVMEQTDTVIPDICAQGHWLAVAMVVFLFGAVLVSGTCRYKWIRYGGVMVASLAMFVPLKVYCVVNGIQSGMLFVNFDAVPQSWVVLLIFAVAAAAMLVYGLYKIIVYLSPKRY